MNITTVGGIERAQSSLKYRVPPVDRSGRVKMITAYGIDIIANVVTAIHSEIISSCFNEAELKDCNRPCGSLDLLIGFEYAAWHPVQIEARGSHKSMQGETNNIVNVHVNFTSLSDFFTIESMCIVYPPKRTRFLKPDVERSPRISPH